MKNLAKIALITALAGLAGCADEPPPRSVTFFLDNPILLEAALVRCTRDRSESRYDAECVNAREAVKVLEAKKDSERRAELEAQSERKRAALRRTQSAAAEARRRAAAAEKRRQEAEYLAQFGELPPSAEPLDQPGGNIPMAVIPEPVQETDSYGSDPRSLSTGSNAPMMEVLPETQTVNDARPPANLPQTPVTTAYPPPESTATEEAEAEEPVDSGLTDLGSIRDELRQRSQDDDRQ